MANEQTVPLILSSRPQAGWSIIDVAGEIDLATAPQLRACLTEAIGERGHPASVVVDLSNVWFCDASGLRVLLATHRQSQRIGGRLRIVCPEGQLLRILRICQLTRVLPIWCAGRSGRR